jgi:excisionase family DNA binding protein
MDSNLAFEPLLDAKKVGRLLGLHPQTVQRLARSRELPALRYGRIWRFRRSDVEAWIQSRVSAAPPPQQA